eukprot:GHVU01171577.1.p1 GENE.GHVU01171577.1~~GHVU01171577.1.p1  ORF type:complete len:388 (-),score=59.01 GHVU01171577.1:80-1174(-)
MTHAGPLGPSMAWTAARVIAVASGSEWRGRDAGPVQRDVPMVFLPLVWWLRLSSLSVAATGNSAVLEVDDDRERFPSLLFTAPYSVPYTLLYFHGNSCDLGNMYNELRLLSEELNANVLGIEYPGYGLTQLVGDEADSVRIDIWAESAFEYLTAAGVPSERVILFGRSIGTGPAARLAATLSSRSVGIGGLILQSPFVSIQRIAADYVPIPMVGKVVAGYWDTADALARVEKNIEAARTSLSSSGGGGVENEESGARLTTEMPLCVLHGEDDEVIPVSHGKQLFENYSPSCKLSHFPEGCGHNNYEFYRDVVAPVADFLRLCMRHTGPMKKLPGVIEVQEVDRVVPARYSSSSRRSRHNNREAQ